MTDITWYQLINDQTYSQLNQGVALTNTNSLTDISPGASSAGQAFLVPGSYPYQGLQLQARAWGSISTAATPQLTLGLYWGGVAGTALASSTFLTASAGLVNATWTLMADIRIDATGTSGVARTMGSISGIASGPVMLPQTSTSGNAVTISTGASINLTVGAQWGNASASNTIQVWQYLISQLN